MTYSVHVSSLFDLLSIQRIFDGLFSTILQSILYIYFFMVSLAFIWVIFYGLHDLFCTSTSSCWPIFNKYRLFWPSLYTSVIYGQLCLFTSWCAYLYMNCILWLYVHVLLMKYSVHLTPLADLVCTLGNFARLVCTHTSLCWRIFCNYQIFMTYLYSNEIYGLFCLFTSPWWAYVYMSDISWLHDYIHLMTYSVLLPSLVDLFCIWLNFLMAYTVHITPCWPIFYTCHLFMI